MMEKIIYRVLMIVLHQLHVGMDSVIQEMSYIVLKNVALQAHAAMDSVIQEMR
jgi:hypothetical protein